MIYLPEILPGNCIYYHYDNTGNDQQERTFAVIDEVDQTTGNIILNNGKDTFKVNLATDGRLLDYVFLDDQILRSLGFIKEEKALYGFPKNTVYTKVFQLQGYGNFPAELFFDIKLPAWALVTPSPLSYFGCSVVHLVTLNRLQNLLRGLTINFKIDPIIFQKKLDEVRS